MFSGRITLAKTYTLNNSKTLTVLDITNDIQKSSLIALLSPSWKPVLEAFFIAVIVVLVCLPCFFKKRYSQESLAESIWIRRNSINIITVGTHSAYLLDRTQSGVCWI